LGGAQGQGLEGIIEEGVAPFESRRRELGAVEQRDELREGNGAFEARERCPEAEMAAAVGRVFEEQRGSPPEIGARRCDGLGFRGAHAFSGERSLASASMAAKTSLSTRKPLAATGQPP